jgi:DNA-binding CsgD family transcriptional regulator
LAAFRNDPRRWRLELLEGLLRIFPASSAASFIVQPGADSVQVVAAFDAGFKPASAHEAFLQEFNDAPFDDPLGRKILDVFDAQPATDILTAARRDLVADPAWYRSSSVERYRRPANVDDCIYSFQRQRPEPHAGPPEPVRLMALCIFRPWDHPQRFTPRERLLLDTLHEGLAWLYRSESTLERLNRATALTPRLKQTLDLLLAGDTERRVAQRMRISIHTVHDYVKALYQHFGVSSRSELMARWIQSGEPLPAPPVDEQS